MDIYELHKLSEDAMSAASNNEIEKLKECIAKGADIEFNRVGLTPLMSAMGKEHWDCVWILIEAGANPNAKNKTNWRAIHQACLVGDEKLTETLMQRGAMLWVKDKNNTTPLHLASSHTLSLVNILSPGIKCDIDPIDNVGETPLMKAVKANKFDIVKCLVECGANPTIKNNLGETVKEMSTDYDISKYITEAVNKFEVNKINSQESSEELLQTSGATPDSSNEAGQESEQPQKIKISTIKKRTLA